MAEHTNDLPRRPDPLGPKGNRPADNARQATPASLLAQMNWQGNEAAQDFLGLNGDMQPAAPAPAAEPMVAPIPAPRAAPAPGDSSWLMDAEHAEQARRAAQASQPEDDEDELDVDAEPDEDEDEAGSLRAPAVLDASWSEPQRQRSSVKRPLVLAGIGLCIVVAGGLAFVQSKSGKDSGQSTELAQAPQEAKPQPKPAPVLEIPKSSGPVAAAGGADARAPLDRSGKPTAPAKPAAEPIKAERIAFQPPAKSPAPAKPKLEPTPPPAAAPLVAATPPASSTPIEPKPLPVAPSVPPEPSKDALASAKAPVESGAEGTAPKIRPPFLVKPPLAPETAARVTDAPAPAFEVAGSTPTQSVAPAGAKSEPAPTSPGDPLASARPDPAQVTDDAPLAPERPRVRVISSTSSPVGTTPEARPASDTKSGSQTAASPTVPAGPDALASVAGSPSLPSAGSVGPEPAPAIASREGSIEAADVLLPLAPPNGVRTAQAKDMQSVWEGDGVPMDQVGSKTKILTPNVGKVRVKLKTNDVFEGKLYAVGEDSVWIEGAFGRMGLESSRVLSVERVGSDAAAGAATAAANDRVRIKMPGGPMFGKFVSREGTKVSVITDAGLKLTVDAKDVEHLGQMPKVIVKQNAPDK